MWLVYDIRRTSTSRCSGEQRHTASVSRPLLLLLLPLDPEECLLTKSIRVTKLPTSRAAAAADWDKRGIYWCFFFDKTKLSSEWCLISRLSNSARLRSILEISRSTDQGLRIAHDFTLYRICEWNYWSLSYLFLERIFYHNKPDWRELEIKLLLISETISKEHRVWINCCSGL